MMTNGRVIVNLRGSVLAVIRRAQTMPMQSSKKWIAARVAVLAGVMPLTGWAQGPAANDAYAYGRHMGWGGWYGMVFGPLFMILVLAAVIAFAVLLVRWLGGPWQGTQPPQLDSGRTALDILKERYARGEINKEEFEERRRVIRES
jgi:putative membrane protein